MIILFGASTKLLTACSCFFTAVTAAVRPSTKSFEDHDGIFRVFRLLILASTTMLLPGVVTRNPAQADTPLTSSVVLSKQIFTVTAPP